MKHLYSICSSMYVSLTALLLFTTLTSNAQQVGVSLAGTGVTNSGGYYEFVPPSYAGSKDSFPLLIFIHGIGELGNGTTNLPTVLRNGVPKLLNNGTFPSSFTVNGRTFSFIVASPQFKNIPGPTDVLSLINYLRKKFPRIDSKRIYVTGLSMGGGATEDFVSAGSTYSQVPAAAVAVCGNMNPLAKTAAAKAVAQNDIPVWFLHNENDPTVPSQYSKDWVTQIDASNPVSSAMPRLTIFNASGHDAWTKSYDPAYKENGMNVYEWLLQYEKGGKVPDTPTKPANKRVMAKTNIGNGMYYTDAMKSFGLNPGDTLCIAAGDYEFIQLGKLVGTADKPIVITNCGGQVRVGIRTLKSDIAFNIMGGQYLHINGSGTPGIEYGFDVNGKNLAGVKMHGMYLGSGSSDIDVHNIYFHDVGIFIVAKTTQECNNPQFWEGKYVMKNVKIHHIKGRYSDYEGFYIGNTHYVMDYAGCKGIKSHHIQDLEVYDNDLQYMGQDGIQIAMTDLGTNKIHHNTVRNYGTSRLDAQSYGMLMGGGSRVRLYNNVIDQGYLPGIAIFGSGISYVYNNTVSNVEHGEGINVADKFILEPVTAYIFNNTIYNTGNTGLTIYAYLTTLGHKVYNNIVIEKSPGGSYPYTGYYIRGAKNIKFDFGDNYYSNTADAGKVVKNVATGDFHLVKGSAAIDKGYDVASWGISTDLDNLSRPVNGKFDMGAYEYNGTSTTPVNKAPVANAGTNISITLPTSTVTLNGSTSADSDGKINAYAWKKVSGPAVGTITSAAAAQTTVTGLTTAGTYVFALTVTDDDKATDADSVTVTVKAAPVANKAPVANAGTNITITLPTSTVTLNGSASADSDGKISAYAWKKVNGPAVGTITSAAAAKTTVTGLTAAGTYVFALTVTDDDKATDADSVTVTVKAAPVANKAPVANAGTNITITLPTSTVTLNGSASADSDGKISAYAWKKVNGPAVGTITSAATAKTTVTGLTAAGTYVFALTVTDDDKATDADSVTVTVKAAPVANKAPVANAGTNITITLPTSTVTLNGSASADSDGKISAYSWKKVSGPAVGIITSAAAAKTTVTGLTTAGTYVFALTVTDDDKATDADSITVTVKVAQTPSTPPSSQPPANKPPVANAGSDIIIQLPVNSITLNGSASKDPDGTIATYFWEKISGPDVKFSNARGAVNIVSAMIAGNYMFRLTVKDNKGATAIDYVNVTVKPISTVNVAPIAKAGSDVTITLPVNSVILNGSGSSDADGQITGYLWQKETGRDVKFSNANGVINVVSGLTAGTYVFELKVTDNRNATATDRMTVTVLPAVTQGKPPVAISQGDLTVTLPTSGVNVDASRSYGINTTIGSYKWKQISGPLTASIGASNAESTGLSGMTFPGKYVFQLTVTDNNGLSSNAIFTITVLDGNAGEAPIIKIYPNPVVNTLYFKQELKNAGEATITIFTLAGQSMKSYILPAMDVQQKSLDVTFLPAGTYLLQVLYKGTGLKMSFKFVKAN
ncbi:PKD domain-containing protein [Chitinophaga tropicalis]|uniref:T9SS type A sorting domain-containing protein n=1 Tax=Chitinophaga tropicalis TaxID=2683588 RepID=A0A7K1U163_9BACT|nr:PKD domain-containing protein [Chitinophaga tropicalis]MVT08102.1 T9SS type A sorting domain-containing protein [Chitinophaga tropicalis]